MNKIKEYRRRFYDSGKPMVEAEIKNGKLNGLCREWLEDGTLIMEYHCEDGEYHGPYKTWWDNGKPKEDGIFNSGKYVGLYTWYHEDGTVWRTHEFPPEGVKPMTDEEAKEFLAKENK